MEDLGKLILEHPNKKIYVRDGLLIKEFDHTKVPKDEVLHQAECQALVENRGLNIPELVEVFKHGENWCVAYKFIKGKTLAELMKENPAKEDEYLRIMLDLQLKMHAISVPKLHRLTTKLQERLSETKGYISATSRYELHTRLDAMPMHEKLCHGDFNPTNIILGEDGKYYIVDWAHATRGNASADIATTYLCFMMDGRKDLAKKYLTMFCQKTDTALQYVQRWIPIVAAAMSLHYAGKDKDYLVSLTDVVEYE